MRIEKRTLNWTSFITSDRDVARCRKISRIVSVDFRKAFYTTDHKLLRLKLQRNSISSNLAVWTKHYLSDCERHTRVKGTMSNQENVTIGVPQASILRSRLFAI